MTISRNNNHGTLIEKLPEMDSTVRGRGHISAKIIADSISPQGIRITTYELEFHRFILAEYNTHRVFSRNAASTRAIPILTQIKNIATSPALPIFYGENMPGMSATVEMSDDKKSKAEEIIRRMLDVCVQGTQELFDLGLHKQHAGRYLEPWMMVKGVLTSTEYDNFFNLRMHKDAQPEIQELARCMWEAREASVPEKLIVGEWHVPYFAFGKWTPMHVYEDGKSIPLADALAISSSCCAQVSYRKLDDSLQKAKDIFNRLVESRPSHFSPLEHQATPSYSVHQQGITHIDNSGNGWSGNLQSWIQHRQLLYPGLGYEEMTGATIPKTTEQE